MIELKLKKELPVLPEGDLLFFTSPGAVQLFYSCEEYQHCSLPVAVIGAGTARALPPHVDLLFIGKGSTQEAAKAYSDEYGHKKTIIVGGTSGRQTVQQQLASNSFTELIIYDTHEKNSLVPECDAYLFTSPSNYRSFLRNNELKQHSVVVAIGESTASEMAIEPMIPASYDPHAVWNTIFSALFS